MMSDIEVGEVWKAACCTGRNNPAHYWRVKDLIRKLVEERAELGYRRQGGHWAFIALTDKEQHEWRMRALRDFGIKPEDWK